MTKHSTIRTLLLYANYTDQLSYYDDWLDSLQASRQFDCIAVDIARTSPSELSKIVASPIDLIVLLHSTNADSLEYLQPLATVLEGRRCPLVSFVGNELNLPFSPMRDKIALLRAIEVDAIATQLPIAAGQWLYEQCSSAVVFEMPHALNPDVFQPGADGAARDIDIGVRSARYPAYLGDNERNELFDAVVAQGGARGLRLDVSTTERLNREQWAQFLRRCKGTVSNEAGTYYLERDDRTVQAARNEALSNIDGARFVIRADSFVHRMRKYVPQAIRSLVVRHLKGGAIRHEAFVDPNVDFEIMFRKHFAGRARAPMHTKCISSRHFEAAGTKTCQILLNGEYNGILRQDFHYIGVERDLSDLDAALDKFMDESVRQRIAENAYHDIMAHHTFERRIDGLFDKVAELV